MSVKFIILTVEPHGNNGSSYAFGIDTSNKPKEAMAVQSLKIIIEKEEFEIKSIKTYQNQGRITSSEVNKWIQKNELIIPKEPIKLIFKLSIKTKRHIYTLYPNQANRLNL